MNIYKGLLFLHGHVFDPAILADVAPAPPAEVPAVPARAVESGRRPRVERTPRAAAGASMAPPRDCCA